MPAQTAIAPLDYVRHLNQLCEDLLVSHRELLGHKNIRRKQQLIRAIRLDLDKLTHALVETKENEARSVLRTFFGESGLVSGICDRLADQNIYHVGFEIHEPIALVLFGIRHWIEHSRRALDVHMAVREYLHFPASQAFQTRVGANAEIMRIWLEVNDRVLMLELFDIQRPADSILAAAPEMTHRNFHPLFNSHESEAGHPHRLARLFASDEIWHYAFHVKSPADVEEIHRELEEIAAREAGFAMAYRAPVHNRYDGSFHTKVIRAGNASAARLELEFVTDYR
jgi:hypothetical protein